MANGDNCRKIYKGTWEGILFTPKYLLWALLLSIAVLLNGCTTTKDGPPPGYVDVSKIPNAYPKNDPRSKYGNMACYRVNGHEYYVMNSAKNYEEQGVASWYGMKFHKRRTSSGERYNLYGMTAAHKTLPLPTYVEVTNLANHRKVIVKVNDRGPFAPNRILDLSYVAAKKLGMLGHGTAYVDVRAIDPTEAVKRRALMAQNKVKSRHFASNNHSKTATYLQVGAFKNRLHAENLKTQLMTQISSPIEITQAGKRLYRVKIGPINDLATQGSITKKLRSIGLTPTHSRV